MQQPQSPRSIMQAHRDRSRSSDSMSNASSGAESTLSAFIARRFSGEQPVFGGNPVTGARELGAAVANSAAGNAADFGETLGSLAAKLAAMAHAVPKPPRAVIISPRFDDEDFTMVAKLDDAKINALLQAGAIDPEDINGYFNLLKIAMDGLKKRKMADQLAEQRRSLVQQYGTIVCSPDTVGELIRVDLTEFYSVINYAPDREKYDRYFTMALTHETAVGGKETNRVLAYYGDAVAKMMIADTALHLGRSVGELNNAIQDTQSNDAFARVMKEYDLVRFIQASGIDPSTKRVAATAFEAVVGALYIAGGCDALRAFNETVKWMHDFEHSTPKSTGKMLEI